MRAGYQKLVVHRRVIVNLSDESAFDGILWAETRDLLVLRDAHLHITGADGPRAVDGEVIIERGRIMFVQVQP